MTLFQIRPFSTLADSWTELGFDSRVYETPNGMGILEKGGHDFELEFTCPNRSKRTWINVIRLEKFRR